MINRVVWDYDLCASAGDHVENSSEIGAVIRVTGGVLGGDHGGTVYFLIENQ